MTASCWHFRNHEMKWFKPFQQFKTFKALGIGLGAFERVELGAVSYRNAGTT